MSSLTDFLLARIAEDEEVARAASPGGWTYPGIESVAGGTLYDETRRIVDVVYEQREDHDGSIVRHLLVPEADANGRHIARHDPARVLAECEAKRRIVAEHKMMPVRETNYGGVRVLRDGCCETCTAWGEYGEPNEDGTPNYCPTLLALATIYADHPDFDPAWRAEVGP